MANYGGPDANAFKLLMAAEQSKTDAITGTIDKLGDIGADFIGKKKTADRQKAIDVTDFATEAGFEWEGKDAGKRVSLFDFSNSGDLATLNAMGSLVRTAKKNKDLINIEQNKIWFEAHGEDGSLPTTLDQSSSNGDITMKTPKKIAEDLSSDGYSIDFALPELANPRGSSPAKSVIKAPTSLLK